MNNTFKSLLSKGVSSDIAQKIIDSNYTLSTLSACSTKELEDLGINEKLKNQIFDSKRPPIPDNITDNLLYKSRRTCCICRDSNRSIIIHHIKEWSESKSNEENNLVVLCLHHHDEAHTRKELSQNLTAERIIEGKNRWEKEIEKLDKEILKLDFKELDVVTNQFSLLKKKWYNFLKKLGMRINLIDDPIEKIKFDFKIYGKSILLIKVFNIEKIEDLINKENLIQNFKGAHFLDSLIVLGAKPFLSNDGFYSNELNIQIGWIYNYGGQNWDSIMLKSNYDISNGKFFVENLLYEETNYKNFLTDDNFDEIMEIWNK